MVAYADPQLGGLDDLVEGRLPERAGEVIANEVDGDIGYALGDVVTVAGGPSLTVVGVAEDIGINVAPTVFTTPETYLEALRSRNPELAQLPPPNVLGVRPTDGTSPAELAERITAADPDLDALTRSGAADDNPGVASIRQSFNVIFLLFALVVPLVTGLFFLILTFQKAGALTLLRAIGGPARRLVGALLVQVSVVLGVGIAVGLAGYTALSSARISGLPLRFESTAVVVWVVLIAGLGVLSSLASIRRVLRIDPIEATTGQGVRP
jgi:putative ABC transport system permease protein